MQAAAQKHTSQDSLLCTFCCSTSNIRCRLATLLLAAGSNCASASLLITNAIDVSNMLGTASGWLKTRCRQPYVTCSTLCG
jgi:hypothetical protein